jgi:hypothetical protein
MIGTADKLAINAAATTKARIEHSRILRSKIRGCMSSSVLLSNGNQVSKDGERLAKARSSLTRK